MTDLYPFSEWSEDKVDRRFMELAENQEAQHSPERRDAIRREIAHLSFELTWRLQDGSE